MKSMRLVAMMAAGLAVLVQMASAATITYVGTDITANAAWRRSSVVKPLDADGNNIYGSDGYFTSAWLANSLPAYATVSLAASLSTYAGDALYTKLDNADGTATIQSGIHYRHPGVGVENDFYIITLTAAASFRLGIITDNADQAGISPSDLRVRHVGRASNLGLISAATDRDRDGDYYLFDIKDGQIGDVFVVSGVNHAGWESNGLAGLTFDKLPPRRGTLITIQ